MVWELTRDLGIVLRLRTDPYCSVLFRFGTHSSIVDSESVEVVQIGA